MYGASSMHRTDIFATSAKAATNLAPVPHPLRHQTKTVHTGDAFLPRRRQKVPEEVKIAPPNPTILELIGHGVMLSHTAPSANLIQC